MPAPLQARFGGDFPEPAAAQVPVQQRVSVGRDEEVEVPVVVVVADRATDAALVRRAVPLVEAQLRRHVDEGAAIVAVERVLVGLLVGEKEVEVAVLVEVEPARADRPPRIVEACRLAHVRELRAVIAEQTIAG